MLRPRASGLAALTAAALVVAGCSGHSSATPPGARSLRTDVPFTPCTRVACDGVLQGAKFSIKMPQRWNGTLLLYSHGYRSEAPTPPGDAPVDTSAVPAPGAEVAARLLATGYALAGSGFRRNGWDVLDGVTADEQLRDYFVSKVGKPDRTYLWGDSLGGLITQTLAEKHPEWVDGAAPLCGVLAGTNLNFDLGLDVAYATKVLLDPTLKLTGFTSHQEAQQAWVHARDRLVAAAADRTDGIPSILLIADLVDAPDQTKTYDGSTIESKVRAKAEALLTALGFATWGRYELEERAGGNASSNVGVDYAQRITAAERSVIEAVSPGATDRLLARLAAGRRLAADPHARAAADRLGNPTGRLSHPTITMHTADDPLVLVQNERVFAQRVDARTPDASRLAQVVIRPPATYPENPGAPYGAGHCNFTTQQRLGVITALDDWVRRGVYPTQVTFARELGAGVATGYVVPPWPAPGRR